MSASLPGDEMLAVTLDACRAHLDATALAPGEGRELAGSLAEAAREAASPGLEHACALLGEALADGGEGETPIVAEWVRAMADAVAAPGADAPADALCALLLDPRCPAPLDAADVAALRPMLVDTGHPGEASDATGAPALPDALVELIDLLGQELDPLRELVDEALAAADPALGAQCAEHVAEQVECFAAAAEAAGLDGLGEASAALVRTWRERASGSGGPGSDAPAVEAAHVALAGYVRAPFHAEQAAVLAAAVGVLDGLPQEGVEALVARLRDPGAAAEMADDTPVRLAQATPELVTLEVPGDVAPELLDTLLQELPVLTAEFSGAVSRLAHGGTLDDVNVAQRAAHTLKGAANTVGVAGPANLTHHAEDILRAFFDAGAVPGGPVVAEMLRVADCLEAMGEALAGVGPAPDDALEVLQQVLDVANRIDADGVGVDASIGAPVPAAPPAAHEPGGPPPPPATDPAEPAAAQVRVPAPLIDEFMRLTGETIILTGQVRERLARTVGGTRSMQDRLGVLQQLGYELEQFIDLGRAPVPGMRPTNDPLFDPLEMDEYNELHTLSRRMVEAAADVREMGRAMEAQLHALTTMIVDQGRLNRESHERVLETRMVPVSSVTSRLQRAVRQAARSTGKRVDLDITGAQTRMDADVLSEIVDPLMHLLRNAVDHGIEPESEREGRGKSPEGHIALDFARVGNDVVVRCTDDGAGIDTEAVRSTAVARGRIGADEAPGEDAVRQLILEPGFSTRTSTTQVSGRGIGLDAVYAKVLSLGGTLDLRSERGAGCVVELGVPLTLISAHALLVRVRQHVFALAARGIEQILHADNGALETIDGRCVYRTGEAEYEAATLDELLVLPPDARASDREPQTAVLTQTERGPVAVLVQEVIDSRDLVVKSLGRYVPRVPGVVGATILGDGSVTPVLDLPDLLRADARAGMPFPVTPGGATEEPAGLPTALVVDDSLSARRALERVMADSGFDVRTARDGLEAVEILRGLRPDVMLVDMEMPRMNGLELVAHVRASAETASVPVVMVTSRSTAKHRDQASRAGVDVYLTKPFSEDELLGHVAALHACA